jgi:hypothetical protein
MAVFGPETLSVMSAVFNDVCKAVEASGRSDVIKEMIASRIIHLARRGETDPIAMREAVLRELGLPTSREGP